MLNYIEIVEWPDGTFDFRVRAHENHNILAASHQGYENQEDCETAANRTTTGTVAATTFSKEQP